MAEIYTRQQFIEDIKLRLGSGIVDVELDQSHYDLAVKRALWRYRQRSDNAMEESFLFLDIQPNESTYTLPDEVQEVRAIYRRGTGQGGGGSAVDPFSLNFINSIYMMGNPGSLGGGGAGSLATYECAMDYQKLVNRMFGMEILYTWNASTKRLNLERKFTWTEQIALHVYNTKPETVLFNDPYAGIWLFDYSVANCKIMLGEARSKFASIAGPQGGITLNGESMKTEGETEITRLDLELTQFVDSHSSYPFIIG